MSTILDPRPDAVTDQLIDLTGALDAASGAGGVPPKDTRSLLLATWNLREMGRFTPKWRSEDGDSPKRDLRSLILIASVLERFDVIALQELQGHTDAIETILAWLNRERPSRWQLVVSDVVRGNAGDHERLGFLFDSSVYDLDGLVGEIVIPPEEVGMSSALLDRQFAKTPYCVSFRSVHAHDIAFVLTTVHVIWGSDRRRRASEANRIATWLQDWVAEPHAWDPDVFALGDFNIDRLDDPAYEPFSRILTIPEAMHDFPRTIFASGREKHYDQIAWYESQPGRFSLHLESCGFVDIDRVLRPGFEMSRLAFSYRISDHHLLWSRFDWPEIPDSPDA